VTEATAGTVEAENPEDTPTEGPDLMGKTAGHRQQNGHKIYYFKPGRSEVRSDQSGGGDKDDTAGNKTGAFTN